MKLTREHIVVLAAFIVVLATLGALYQFYYVPRLQIYKDNLKRRDDLQAALTRVEKTFDSTVPEVIIKKVIDQIPPLEQELLSRSKFFNMSDLGTIDPIPENKILRIYYTEQYNKMINELRQEAFSKNIYVPDMIVFSGVPQPNELSGRTMTPEQVTNGLRRLKFGCAMYKLMLESKAPYINQVLLWPNRIDPAYDKLLRSTTTGFSFWITYPDLVNFLEKLRMSDRYFAVNAISLQNRSLRVPTEPLLEVQLLVTQAEYNPPVPQAAPAPGQLGPPGAPMMPALFGNMSPEQRLASANMGPRGMAGRRGQEPLTTRQRYWRTFKKYFWPF